MQPVVSLFVDRGLISDSRRAEFEAALGSAKRLRNSVWAELAIIAFVYLVGVGLIWRTQLALDVASWQGATLDGRWRPTMAGWWLGVVSLPLFQFLLLRGISRCLSGLDSCGGVAARPAAVPTHPDRCGGLNFLASIVYAFTPLLLAQGVVLAGMIAAASSTPARS
jgi:hypothetical protein